MNDPGNLEDKKIEFDDNQKEIPGASAIFSLLTEAQRKKSTTFKVQSNLLDKVKSFLPQLQSENEKLQVLAESDPGKVNIENINENDEHVEMNIGVFQGELISNSESEDSDSSVEKEESKISKSKLIEELSLVMVRNRVPKCPKGVSDEAMNIAVSKVLMDKASIRSTATAFGIPKSTLIDNVRRAKELREQEQGGIPVPIQAGVSNSGTSSGGTFNSAFLPTRKERLDRPKAEPCPSATERNPPVSDLLDPCPSPSTAPATPAAEIRYSSALTPEDVRPYPKALLRKQSNRGGRKKGASRVLTDTPEKDKIEAAMMAKKAKQDEKDAKARLVKKNMKKPTSQTKSKGQKRKQQTSLCDQSTDEESVVSVHLDDDTDDSLHIGDDELTEPLALGTLSIRDYVLVEFEGKNSSLHYVGFVKEKDNSEVFVSFLRRKDSDSSKFFFPQVVDESYVNLADVKMKLPIPSRSGGTARVAEMIEFSDVDFSLFPSLR
ncbi:hypothetical protein QYM36_011951 [Artemia franciscana]|uniref:HTH psq-type domain-containing protein n=1 Tax=Artemia franciscana TaxID=6661 RepID=A0AA88HK91_ARTSF|nr:hypothetical protein QYM36_011951 [Artemia franciscana]